MKQIHTPRIDTRYWTGITLASVFGTNMGDFYAHESGLGITKGIAVLALLAAAVFVVERFEHRRHEAYYWLVIILIRTGATNIADYLAYRVHIPIMILTLSLVGLLAFFGWGTRRRLLEHNRTGTTFGLARVLGRSAQPDDGGSEAALQGEASPSLPETNAAYWLAMLSAGVLGTVAGDICEHLLGEGAAVVVLTAVLLAVLAAGRGQAAQLIALYWATVAVARTAGTAIGDWLAENRIIHVGLAVSTLLSGITFVAVLVLWKSRLRILPGAAADAD
jgi:uncharacterized membrane-anchored protein